MMRKIIVLALIAGAAYFVYQRMNQPTTEEDQLVDAPPRALRRPRQ